MLQVIERPLTSAWMANVGVAYDASRPPSVFVCVLHARRRMILHAVNESELVRAGIFAIFTHKLRQTGAAKWLPRAGSCPVESASHHLHIGLLCLLTVSHSAQVFQILISRSE